MLHFFIDNAEGSGVLDKDIKELNRKAHIIAKVPLKDTLKAIQKSFDPELFVTGNCGLLAFTLNMLYPDPNNFFFIAVETDQYDSEVNQNHFTKNSEIMELSLTCGFFHVMFSNRNFVYDIYGKFHSEEEPLQELLEYDKTIKVNTITFQPRENQSLISTMLALNSGTMPTMGVEDIIEDTYETLLKSNLISNKKYHKQDKKQYKTMSYK